MHRFIATAWLLAILLNRAEAQCTRYEDGYEQYDISLCTMTSDQMTPPVIENLNPWIPTSVDDSVSPLFNLNFSLLIYGVPHESFYMNTNGALFFGTATSSSGTLRIPFSSSYGDYLPVIAPLWTDLYYTVGTSSASYGTSGTVGNRTFIVRYHNFHPYSTRSSNPALTMSFDTIFYEDRPGDIDIRYYRIDQTSSTYKLSLGLQSWDDGGSAWTMFTDTADWPTISNTIRGKQLSLRYVGTTVDTERCGGLGYQFDNIRGMQLNYTDPTGVKWYYSPCGVVSNPICRNNVESDKSMLCQISTINVPTDLAVFGPGSTYWQYPPGSSTTGVEALHQSGIYCSSIGATRFATVSFVCEETATTPYISAATTPATCVHRVTVRTSLACGGGSRGNDTELLFPASTLPTCNIINGAAHVAALCPRPSADRRPITLTTATSVLVGVGTGTAPVALQFPFWFYGNTYNNVHIGLNGALYFGTASTSIPTAPPAYGFTTPNSFPAIFAFGASMSNLVYAGLNAPNITHTHQVVNGRRAFIVRYWNMKYTAYRGLYDMIIDFDVILSEGQPGGVEIRYYVVTPNLNVPVSIGIHGPDALDVYTGYVNYEYMSAQLANQLQGATLNFTYVGRTNIDACAAYGVNFTGLINTDLVYSDVANNAIYYLAPCGQLRSTASGCRAGTSVCRVANGAAIVLSGFNPSAITWQTSPAPLIGVRSVLRDGAFCSSVNQPRTVQIDWICSKLYSTPTLIHMSEVSTCVYNAEIATREACFATVACSNVTSHYYAGTLCPTVAPRFRQTNPVAVLAGLDDASVRIRIPIEFHFFGLVYRYVWIGSNGQLGFGPIAANAVSGTLPFGFSQLDQTPLIAAWMTDLHVIDDSIIAYSLENIDGEQVFVVRFENVEQFGNNQAGVEDTVSFDILLFAGVAGKVEIRYYTMNQPSRSARVTVGIQNDDTDPEETLIVANSLAIDAGVAASFSNSTLRITYTGPDVTTEFCGAKGYNLSSITDRDLTFTSGTSSYALRVCGIVADTQCQSSPASDRAQLCRKVGTTTPTLSSLSEWNPAENYWLYPSSSSGLLMVSQNGPYCSGHSAPAVTILNFVCSPSTTSPVITSVAEVGTCTHQANISTNLVCGPGDRNVPEPPPRSTLTACRSFPGLLYDATMCPRALNDTYVQPELMINPIRVLTTDDAYINIEFGFELYLYDRVETNVALSSNGLLTFGYTPNSQHSPSPFPSMGLNQDSFPALSPFFTDLINIDTTSGYIPYQGFIAYSYAGTEPNRRVIIRFQDVDYYSTRNSVAEQSVSFDVILTEGNPGGVEVRYYVVDPAAQQTALIGMHGYGDTYTSVSNLQPITRALAGQLSGSTVRYRFTGTSQPDICHGVPGGYNLTSLSIQDLNYNSSTYQFWVRPCGSVSAPVCTSQYATQRVSVCQATLNGASTWALASGSPGATTFTKPTPDVLRATISDGQMCGAAPRQTIIDYQCDSQATRAYIDYVNENSTCVFYVRIISSTTCLNRVFTGVAANATTPRYDARLFYEAASMSRKLVQTSPIPLLAGSDDGKIAFPIPFPVRVYGIPYTQVQVSVNGWLSFETGGPTGVPAQGFPLASTFATALPVLSVYMADLFNSNSNNTGGITWSIEGVAPRRFVLVRWDAVNYYTTRPSANLGDRLISFDVKFYENSNDIDVVYWQVTTHTAPITIGLQGAVNAYTAVNSGQTVADRGLFMEGYLLRYSWTDPMAPVPSSSSSSSSTGSASSSAVISSSVVSSSSSSRISSSSSSSQSSTASPSSSASSTARSSSSVISSSAASSSTSSSSAPTSTPSQSSTSSSTQPVPITAVSSSIPLPIVSSSSSSIPSVPSSSSTEPATAAEPLSSSSTASETVVNDSSKSSLSGGAISGIVIGVLIGSAILCIVLAMTCCGWSRHKGSMKLDETSESDTENSQIGGNEIHERHSDIEMETV